MSRDRRSLMLGWGVSFQRARSDEQREIRRRVILDTATAMLDEMPMAEVTLNELSRRALCRTIRRCRRTGERRVPTAVKGLEGRSVLGDVRLPQSVTIEDDKHGDVRDQARRA